MARNWLIVMASILSISKGVGIAGGEAPPDWREVSIIFVERCVMCHSAQGAARGLRLDSYEAAIAGSSRGPVLVPGDAAGSELVRRLLGESLPRMPFLSYSLPEDQIDMIVDWVNAGLPNSRG